MSRNPPNNVLKMTLTLTTLTAMGILFTVLFQIMTARVLPPYEFKIFAAFLSIVNIAAIGSGALQNAVAVNTARIPVDSETDNTPSRKSNSSLIEALWLGVAGALVFWVFSSIRPQGLFFEPGLIAITTLTIPLCFIFAVQIGMLQGAGKSLSATGWSTLATILRFAISALLLAVIYDSFWSFAIAVLAAQFVITVASWLLGTRTLSKSRHKPFSKTTLVVLSNTMLFAWLTNFDVVSVAGISDSRQAANYAVSSILVKTGLIVPGTLSLIFLPRFAKNPTSRLDKTSKWIELISIFGALFICMVLGIFGPSIVEILFGSSYHLSSSFLLCFALSFTPWVFIQAVMIKSNAKDSWFAPIMLGLSVLVQFILFQQVLPNIYTLMLANGVIGVLAAILLKISTQSRN